jgi:hypothetical protein
MVIQYIKDKWQTAKEYGSLIYWAVKTLFAFERGEWHPFSEAPDEWVQIAAALHDHPETLPKFIEYHKEAERERKRRNLPEYYA